jgi:hypothetical protein
MSTAAAETAPRARLPVRDAIEAIVARHGEVARHAATRGVNQVADRWQPEDGDGDGFVTLCRDHFVADAPARARLLDRLERAMETVSGHLYEIRRDLRWWTDVRTEACPGVDDVLAKFDPAPDLSDQLYRQRIGFIALLNFPRSDLAEMLKEGGTWSVDRWAESRLAQAFGPRIPPALGDRARRVSHEASMFVSGFHIPVETLVDSGGKRWLPTGRKLLAHWLVREEVKANYGDREHGLARQRALMWVMARHIDGTIPAGVMDGSNTLDWDSERNTLGGRPAPSLHGPQRYRHWLSHRDLAFEFDRLYPEAPTAIARKFELDREIPEADVERLLTDLLGHPVMAKVAQWLRNRLGRALEPHDIYFEDIAEVKPAEAMNAAVKRLFPDEKAFERKLPEVLKGLGFTPADAEFLGSRIRVEIARGSGHAMRPGKPEYGAWLRTSRLDAELGWDGFDTAMHELGHNLEQLCSTHFAPRPLLRGVPNTACTEAFAFLYQSLGRQVLGLETPEQARQAMHVDSLATMLAAFQIAGPSLLELHAWRWIYANPKASPEQLRDEVLAIAERLWSRFYEPHFGKDPYHTLAAYQHMVGHPLYLADYTIGHVMSHQIRSHLTGRDLATETKRITSIGSVTPDAWMRKAVGAPLSIEPLARAADEAIAALTP